MSCEAYRISPLKNTQLGSGDVVHTCSITHAKWLFRRSPEFESNSCHFQIHLPSRLPVISCHLNTVFAGEVIKARNKFPALSLLNMTFLACLEHKRFSGSCSSNEWDNEAFKPHRGCKSTIKVVPMNLLLYTKSNYFCEEQT